MLQLWVDHTLCQRMPTERIFNQSLLDAKVQKLTKSEKTKEEPATKVVPQKEVEEIKTEENAAALTSRDASLQGMLEEASKMLRVINVPEDGKQKTRFRRRGDLRSCGRSCSPWKLDLGDLR